MSLFDRFKSRVLPADSQSAEVRSGSMENPAVSLSSPAIWSWLLGGEPTAAGEDINHHTAMSIVTVYACVRIIAESVASLPLKLYDVGISGRKEAFENPLYDILSAEPNSEMSAFSFWECMVGCTALTGNSYAQIIRNGAGQVDSMLPLQPLKTEPYRKPTGELSYRTTDGSENGAWRDIPAANMLHIPLFSYDGLKGLSPIMQCRQALGLARASEKFGARFFGNGSRPGGVMSTKSTLNEKDKQNVRENWERTQSGAQQGKTAFLFGDWTYQQIGLSPEDSQFLSTRQFQRAEIAAMFRLDPHFVGDTSRLSNSNHEQASLSFVTDTLRPYLSRIEAECKRKLLPKKGRNSGRFQLEFDVRERLRGDFQTTMAGFAIGRQWGWYSGNDVLRELGDNPRGPELDVYLVPVNMQNSKLLLNTEPTLDQPVGTKPADAPDDGTDDSVTPTKAERMTLERYTMAYIKLFRHAVRTVCDGTRDFKAVAQAFGPSLESIADLSADESRALMDLDAWQFDARKVLDNHLQDITKRAAKWNVDDLDQLAAAELVRSVRALVMSTIRAAGIRKASLVLEEKDGNEQE